MVVRRARRDVSLAIRSRLTIQPLSLVLAAVSLLLFCWLAEQVVVQRTEPFDLAIRGFLHRHASPSLTTFFRFVTNVGDWPVVGGGSIVLLLAFWYRRWFDYIRLLLFTLIGAGLLDGTLKLAFHRPRPDPFFIAKPTTYSFPSGHSLISLCFYGLVAGIVASRLHQRWQRVAVWSVASLLIGTIGLSRIYLGVHWPSDVLAGYAAAILWMAAVRMLAQDVPEAPSVDEAADTPAAIEESLSQ